MPQAEGEEARIAAGRGLQKPGRNKRKKVVSYIETTGIFTIESDRMRIM
jgi:hypothetical protein